MTPLESELQQHGGLLGAVYGAIFLLGLPCGLILWQRVRMAPPDWSRALRRLQWRPWTGRETLILVAWLMACHLLASRAEGLLNRLSAETGLTFNSLALILQSLVFHVAGLVCVGAILIVQRRGLDPAFGLRVRQIGRDVLRGVIYFFALMPPLLLTALLYNLILQGLGQSFTLQEVAFALTDETNPWMRAGFVGVAVVLAPLFEEIFFRGIGLVLLARRVGGVAAVGLLSALFAMIHFHLPALLPLFLLSIALCLAYIQTGSLLVPMVMHALFNSITVGILLLTSP